MYKCYSCALDLPLVCLSFCPAVKYSYAMFLISVQSPYSVVRLKDETSAKALVNRSISSKGVYELWGTGTTYEELHADLKNRSSARWPQYQSTSYKFELDTFSGSRTLTEQKVIIESFSYMSFAGPIKMKDPDQTFTIFEEYLYGNKSSLRIYLGRFIGGTQRHILNDYTLKKRDYINTTSMDSELALLTANLTLANAHTLFYDPFVGTGSLPLACSHFGARTMGSDIDGRMVRGKGDGKDIRSNFKQYGLLGRYLDGWVSDLTHSPIREGRRWLDGIVGDPPYGIREGLKVLGRKEGKREVKEAVWINGEAAHL